MHKEALAVAAALQNRGIKPGNNIALLGLTSRDLVTAMQGVWLAGACVNMLPIPMRMNSIAEFVMQTRAHLSYSDARMLLLDPGLAALYEAEVGDPPTVLFAEIMPDAGKPAAADYREIADDSENLAVLQFTSGSTSVPKGVMLPQSVLSAKIDAMDEVVTMNTLQTNSSGYD